VWLVRSPDDAIPNGNHRQGIEHERLADQKGRRLQELCLIILKRWNIKDEQLEICIDGIQTRNLSALNQLESLRYKITNRIPAEKYVGRAVGHIPMRQSVVGIRVSITLPHDPRGINGPWGQRPDVIVGNEEKRQAFP
jgi:small subunit ribosomal protein S3e